MIITAANYKKNTYNFNYNQSNSKTNFINQNAAFDSFELSTNKMKKDVSFGSFFGLSYTWSPDVGVPKDVHADIDKDATLLTKNQIEKIKRDVVFEVFNLIISKICTEEKKERLKKLMHSEYMNYEPQEYMSKNGDDLWTLHLKNVILYKKKSNKVNSKLYEQFIIDSMMPDRNFSFKNDNGGIINKSINKILESYLSMDENKYPAQNILNLAEHIINKDIKDFDYEKFLLECVRNDKPKMTSIISQKDKIDLSEKIDKTSDKNIYEEIMESKNPEILAIFDRSYLYNLDKGRNAVLTSYFSVPEHKTPDEVIQWLQDKTNNRKYNVITNVILPPLESNLTTFDEKNKFLDDLFKKVKESYIEKNDDFDNYHCILFSISENPEENFNFPQYHFDKLANLNGFDSKKLSEHKKYNMHKIFIDDTHKMTKTLDIAPKKTTQTAPVTETIEVFNLDDLEKIYNDMIENNENLSNDANKSVKFILNNLPDIFLTSENEEQYKKIVDKIKSQNGDFTLTNKMGNNLAHLAIISENPLLIELAIKKNVPFDVQNNSRETALDLIEKFGSNPKVVEATKNIRVNCPELLVMTENDIASGVKLILNDKRVDVNSRELETQNTAWLTGALNNAVDVMNVLKKHPELDKNAVNKEGDNAGIMAARAGNAEIIKLLNELEDFDINYINPKTFESVYTEAQNVETLNAALENKNANPNITMDGSMPPILKLIDNFQNKIYEPFPRKYMTIFNELCKNENVDLSFKYKNRTLSEYLDMYTGHTDVHEDCMNKFSEILRQRYFNSVKKTVEQNGLLSIDEIKEFVTYPNIEKLISQPLNNMNEPIGFFLADNAINRKNITDFLNIIKILKDNYYDFDVKNKMGQTLMDKSKDAENEFLVEYMLKKHLVSDNNNDKVKKEN